jgi:phospholipid transport system transporter-binding protein
LNDTSHNSATLTLHDAERASIAGVLDFGTVGALLETGSVAILAGQAAFIDLGGVTATDSAGLALLLEWLSVARDAKRSLRYENVPIQLQQLARLSEVEELIVWG